MRKYTITETRKSFRFRTDPLHVFFGIFVAALPLTVLADDYIIPWYSSDNGGGRSTHTSSGYALTCTIGQADAGVLTGGNYELLSGFLPVPSPQEPLGGDCDDDGDIDLTDYHGLQENCLTGPHELGGDGLPEGCGCVDFDGDRDVDLEDAAFFQTAFTG